MPDEDKGPMYGYEVFKPLLDLPMSHTPQFVNGEIVWDGVNKTKVIVITDSGDEYLVVPILKDKSVGILYAVKTIHLKPIDKGQQYGRVQRTCSEDSTSG